MEVGDAAQWAVVIFVMVGLVATWWRNGKSQERRAGALETEVKHIKGILEDKDSGLSALKQGINEFRIHCAKISTSIAERVSKHDKEISEVKDKVGGKK